MCSNNIASEGLCAIARAMRSNGSLHSVYIWGNKLEEPACRVSIFVRWPSWRRHFGFRRCVLRICKWWLKKLTIDRFRKFRFVHLVLYVCFIWSYHYLSSNDMVLPSLFKKKKTQHNPFVVSDKGLTLETLASLSSRWKFDPYILTFLIPNFNVSLPHWRGTTISSETNFSVCTYPCHYFTVSFCRRSKTC